MSWKKQWRGRAYGSLVVLALAAASLGLLACGQQASKSTQQPAASNAAATAAVPAGDGHLVVADTDAAKVYVYKLPAMELVTTFDQMKLSAHVGATALPDGRVLFSNDLTKELVALRIPKDGKPEIVGRAKMVTPTAWAAVDPNFRYYVASSITPDTDLESVTVVDLNTYQSGSIQLDTKGNEAHPFLVGDMVYTGIKGSIVGYKIADVMRGQASAPVRTIEVGDGLHGPVYAPSLNRIYITTLASLEGFNVSETGITAANKIPWDVDGLAGGRNARPRLANDGNTVYGVASSVVKPEEWADRRNDIHIADLKSGAAKRLTFDKGTAIRFQLSSKYAMFVNLHPGGDHAYLFDVDPKSPGFQKIAAKVKLDPLANPPLAGKLPAGTETRGAALTPDGKWGFVSHGGEGLISVIDTSKQQVVNKVKVPTALKGGGYLIAVQHGAPLIDLIGR